MMHPQLRSRSLVFTGSVLKARALVLQLAVVVGMDKLGGGGGGGGGVGREQRHSSDLYTLAVQWNPSHLKSLEHWWSNPK